MDVNEFMQQVRPAGKRSRIAPFLSEILTLRERGFSLEQVREFLSRNGVEVSVGGLSAYLSRQGVHGHSISHASVSSRTSPGPPETAAEETTPPTEEAGTEVESPGIGSRNPADLDRIIGSNPDLAALAKIAKRKKK